MFAILTFITKHGGILNKIYGRKKHYKKKYI